MSTTDTDQPTEPADADKPSVDELQADVERNRQQLADTVEALTAKLDVKSRTKARIADTRRQAADRLDVGRTHANQLAGRARSAATTDDGKPTPAALGTVAALSAAVVAVGVLVWWRRR